MELSKHWLTGPEVVHLHCDKCTASQEWTDMIILHGTDGANAMSSAHYLARRDTSVSAHVVVSRTAEVIQILPFNVRAWHAGVSSYAGRKQLNDYSIGIEIDNAGQLHRRHGRFFTWFNKEIMPDQVFCMVEKGKASYWHRYTREQIARVEELCLLLARHYPVKYLLRHSDVTTRKVDPGPAFPFDEVLRSTHLKI